MARVGVLALQGGFAAHARLLRRLGHEAEEVRTAAHLEGVEGLVLPGGESTTQLKLLALGDLEGALSAFVGAGRPILATCAGLILAARRVNHPEQRSFGWLDIAVERNAYGRQLDSFEAMSEGGLPLVFIRAPRVVEIGAGVQVRDRYAAEPILIQQGPIWGAAFHPELTDDTRVHQMAFGSACAP